MSARLRYRLARKALRLDVEAASAAEVEALLRSLGAELQLAQSDLEDAARASAHERASVPRGALRRVLAMAEEMSRESGYAHVDDATGEISADLAKVRAWLGPEAGR